jgi:hypothetical protein
MHGQLVKCKHCDALAPSARHYFEHCPGPANALADIRDLILREHRIPLTWWLSRPAVTSKTAWLTYDADPSFARRAELQIAVAKFSIAMLAYTRNVGIIFTEEE